MSKIVEMAGRLLRVKKVRNKAKGIEIPTGKSQLDVAKRKELIKKSLEELDKVFCPAMDSYVYFNAISRKEIREHSSKSHESTAMALNIKGLLQNAVYVGELPKKQNSTQRHIEKMHFLSAALNGYGPAKITIGEYKAGKLVQYCVTYIADENGK